MSDQAKSPGGWDFSGDRVRFLQGGERLRAQVTGNVRNVGGGGRNRFGTRGSLSVDLKRDVWFDHEQGVGGGVLKLIEHRLGLNGADARQWLAEQELMLQRRTRRSVRGHLVATHDYCDAHGTIRYQVLRYKPKRFKQRRPGSRPGDPHIYNLDGIEPLPYRLPEMMEAIAHMQPIVSRCCMTRRRQVRQGCRNPSPPRRSAPVTAPRLPDADQSSKRDFPVGQP